MIPRMTMIVALVLALGAMTGAALAQQPPARCAEGRALNGECVNSSLAVAMRKQTLAVSQPKFSYTAPARLPSEDHGNVITKHYHEMLNLFVPPPTRITTIRP